jgi:hypothetical protein
MEPIAYKIAEGLMLSDGENEEPVMTARLALYEYGMVYERVNFCIAKREGDTEWAIDLDTERTFRTELVMN